VRGAVVDAVALVRLRVGLLPVGLRLPEARVHQRVSHLGDRPEPPVVAEGLVDAAAVRKLEVDVVDGALLDRVEQVLVPYVVVAVVLPRLGHGALCVRAAVEVEEEEPVALQAVADLRARRLPGAGCGRTARR
jgi:hypothetical protein